MNGIVQQRALYESRGYVHWLPVHPQLVSRGQTNAFYHRSIILESQPRYSADYQLVNTEAFSASHARGYGKLIK